MKRIFLGMIFLGAVWALHAQTWSQKLSAAERDYEEGRLTNIPERLAEGFELKEKEGGYSKEERIRALKLITKVYIFIDDEPKSEEFLVKLLKADPEHRLNPIEDPAELYFLYDKFQSKPIFRLGLRIGPNKSFPVVLRKFGTGNIASVEKIYNGSGSPPGNASSSGTLGLGGSVELLMERHLWYGIEVGGGFQFRRSQYDIENYITYSNAQDPSLATHLTNEQTYFRVPAFIRYNFRYDTPDGAIPYVTVGTSYDYLMDAQYSSASREGGTQYVLDDGSNLKDLELAHYHNWSLFWAAGVKLRVSTHFVTFEARYDKSMLPYINADNRWSGNQYLTYDLAFVEDDLALDMLTFTVGYTHSIYNPKKLKEYR